MFCKKGCLQKLRKFDKKTPVLKSLSNRAVGLRTCNFLKNRLQHKCFSSEICETLTKKKYLQTSALVSSQVILFTIPEANGV